MSKIRLVYVSTAAVPLRDDDLVEILEAARSRNSASNVTGLLAYNGLNFMQALEGDSRDVLTIMASITADPRHSGIVVISREAISEPAFDGWSMRLSRTGRASDGIDGLLGPNGIDETLVSAMPRSLATMFENFISL